MNSIKKYLLNRIEKLKKNLNKNSAIILFNPINCYYFTNFSASFCYIIFTGKQNYFITDGRYYNNAVKKIKYFDIILAHKEKYSILASFRNEIENIFLEKDYVNIELFNSIKKYLKGTFYDISFEIAKIRAVKDEMEIRNIEAAGNMTYNLYKYILKNKFYEYKSEIELKNLIKIYVLKKSYLDIAFEPIVSYDKRTAYPHYESGEYKNPGANILLDFGISFNKYKSDLTRTILLNKIKNLRSKKLLSNYFKLVEEASNIAKSLIKPEIPVKIIDAEVKKFFKKYKVGENFIHSTGHGVGLDIHEYPAVSEQCEYILQKNNVITIEPGLYFNNLGGIRIEDTILVTDNGYQILTK